MMISLLDLKTLWQAKSVRALKIVVFHRVKYLMLFVLDLPINYVFLELSFRFVSSHG